MYRMRVNKKTLPATLLILSATLLFACNRSSLISNSKETASPPAKENYVKDEVIVKFKNDVVENRIKEINSSLGCEIMRSIGQTKTFLIKIKTGEDVEKIIKKYKKFEEVEYAEPNFIKHTH